MYRFSRKQSWERALAISIVAMLLLVGVLFLFVSHRTEKKVSATIRDRPVARILADRRSAQVDETAKLLSAAERSQRVHEKLRNAYNGLVAAKTYRVVTTTPSAKGGWATFTYLRATSPKGELLLRMEILNFDASGAVVPHLCRTYMTNQSGSWQMGDFQGSEDVAFRITGSPNDDLGKGMYEAFLAQARPTLDPSKTYTEASGVYGGRAVNLISVESPGIAETYSLDATSGELVYSSFNGGYSTIYETNLDIPADSFAVPSDMIVMETQDPDRARGYLFDPPTPTPVPPELPNN